MATTITSTETVQIRKGLARRHVGTGPKPADTRPVIGERTITEYQAEGIVSDITASNGFGHGPWTITLTDSDTLPVVIAWIGPELVRPQVGDRITATWTTRSDSDTAHLSTLVIL